MIAVNKLIPAVVQSRRPAGGPDGYQSQSCRRLTLLVAYSSTTERAAVSEHLIINAILPGLRGVTPNRPKGGWSFFCPLNHRKKNAPAVIWVNDEGWISVHCCDCRRNDELREALGRVYIQTSHSLSDNRIVDYPRLYAF